MADAAAAQLKEGTTTFDQVIADQGKKLGDVRLGDFSKESMPDQKLAEAAFKVGAAGGRGQAEDALADRHPGRVHGGGHGIAG